MASASGQRGAWCGPVCTYEFSPARGLKVHLGFFGALICGPFRMSWVCGGAGKRTWGGLLPVSQEAEGGPLQGPPGP